METLTLNDGTVINGHGFESDGILWLYMYDITLTAAFDALNVPAKTQKIMENQGGQTTVFSGYNHLFCIREESGGMISAGLKHQ